MNGAHLHLMLVHLPVMGFLLALPLAVIATWRITERGWFGAAVLLCALAMGGAAGAFATGELAEDIVETLPGVSGSVIHEHEERAELALAFGLSTGSLALVLAFLWGRVDETRRRIFAGVLAFDLLLTAGMFAYTANAGGKIRHPEVVSIQAAQTLLPGAAGKPDTRPTHEDHDEDHDDD